MAPKRFRKRARGSVDTKQNRKIAKLEKFVYKTIENKQIDFHGQATFGNLGQTSPLPIYTTQGVEDGGLSLSSSAPESARVGNSLTLMSQDIRMIIARNSNAASPTICRVLLVESVNGSHQLNYDDVVQYGDYSLYGGLAFVSPLKTNVDVNKKYKVHFDKTFTLAEGAAGTMPATKIIKTRIKNFAGGRNKVVTYDDMSAIPNNHNLQVLYLCDKTAGGTSVATLTMSVRSRYKDA